MDVIIITTATLEQKKQCEEFLQDRAGLFARDNSLIIVEDEDWNGPAGNGLGTLYAYQKARKRLNQTHGLDLLDLQRKGGAVVICHSVGRGQRLYPLTATENFNKSALKIPSGHSNNGQRVATVSILEAVLMQVRQLLPYRRERLSVFWGDQIFLADPPIHKPATAAVDLYVRKMAMPTKEQWNKDKLGNYGFIALCSVIGPQVCEKCSYDDITGMIAKGLILSDAGVAVSIGAFSCSVDMTKALLDEFAEELNAKQGFIDCDPSLWMPLTLSQEAHRQLIAPKGIANSASHYKRIENFKKRFQQENPSTPIFQVTDIGKNGQWWDFGTVAAYYNSLMTLCGQNQTANAMRHFFHIDNQRDQKNPNLKIDKNSVLINCEIDSGTISHSVVVGVKAKTLELSDSVLINCTLSEFTGEKCLLYGVEESEPLYMHEGCVRSDIPRLDSDQRLKFCTSLDRDGKNDWDQRLELNPCSYSEICELLGHKIVT
jgi:hypothetical protein